LLLLSLIIHRLLFLLCLQLAFRLLEMAAGDLVVGVDAHFPR
jgi:predicted membrane chloride channel (bestrophin family)